MYVVFQCPILWTLVVTAASESVLYRLNDTYHLVFPHNIGKMCNLEEFNVFY